MNIFKKYMTVEELAPELLVEKEMTTVHKTFITYIHHIKNFIIFGLLDWIAGSNYPATRANRTPFQSFSVRYHLKFGIMKKIKLVKGQFALVDDEDYDYLNQFTWRLTTDGRYATREQHNKGVRKHIAMHREIMGFPKELIIDHIDHNPLNNQKSNLRLVTKAANAWNGVAHKDAKSKYKGVSTTNKSYYRRSKKTGEMRHYVYPDWFVAQISINGKQTNLGIFKTEEEAARAYDKKAFEVYGEFARLNFPDPLKEVI